MLDPSSVLRQSQFVDFGCKFLIDEFVFVCRQFVDFKFCLEHVDRFASQHPSECSSKRCLLLKGSG